MYADLPLKPSPVTLNTDPASGVSAFSSSVINCVAHVTYSSSKFLPPQQHDVILLAGNFTDVSSLPKIAKLKISARNGYCSNYIDLYLRPQWFRL